MRHEINADLVSGWVVTEDGRLYKPNGDLCESISSCGYRRVNYQGTTYLCHRIIFFLIHGYVPEVIDHVDQNPLNNAPDNLRESDTHRNNHNKGRGKDNKSGVKGVHWCKSRKRWVALIDLNGKRKIKRFKSKSKAVVQRLDWEAEINWGTNEDVLTYLKELK